MLIIDKLKKSYESHVIFEDFSYVFPKTGLYFITGNSGAGKTTLFRIIAGLEKADEGSVAYDGSMMYLFQDRRLFPTLTALENVLLVAPKKERAALQSTATGLLLHLGLEEDDLNKYPDELSGGMQQRVAIARAFLLHKDLLLLDEPTKELDEENQSLLRTLIAERAKETLVLCATHNEDDIRLLGGTVIPLN